jgi:hypothetical protein
MARARRRLAGPVALTVALLAIPAAGAPAEAVSAPSIKLVTADPSITIARYGTRAWIDPGIYVAALDGAFEIRISRTDYDHPLEADRHIYAASGDLDEPLPVSTVRSMIGLRRFIHVTVTNHAGRTVLDRFHAFCPASAVRVNDDGPQIPTYPGSCWGSPFTLGAVWGIDDGWATSAMGYSSDAITGPDGEYDVTVAITDRYRSMFGIADEDASSTVSVTVVTKSGGGCPPFCGFGSHRGMAGNRAARVPIVNGQPSPETAPDLVALPAWSIQVDHRRTRDFLTFGATVWNAGPAPLVVEGFRRDGEETMDAYQYFTNASDVVVGKVLAGDMMWDDRHDHEHWHFSQFARYSLLDANRSETVVSRKEAFCLAPTDAIDLLAQRATWNPGLIGLGGSNCGYGPAALWVREVLPTGWGDTYFQGLPGQSFDITDLPNGTYYIQVEANHLGLLLEGSMENNVELREIRLGGIPGSRTVTVPPWHGIDTEGLIGGGSAGAGSLPQPMPSRQRGYA